MAGKKKENGNAAAGAAVSLCKYTGCKQSNTKFGFCADHFDWFKFGLITKNGEHAADFEKKMDHFIRQQAKRKTG